MQVEQRREDAEATGGDEVPLRARLPLLRRQRLERLLDAACAGPATVVSIVAPVGYGKSALVESWAARSVGRTVVWVDPGSPLPSPSDPLLAASAGAPVTMVVDDAQERRLPGESEALLELADRLPSTATLVVVSRSRSALRLGRLRVRDRLVEIGAGDLALRFDEIAALVDASSVAATPDDVRHLEHRTEGWPAAVALVLRGCAARGVALTDGLDGLRGDHDELYELFREEVLDALDGPTRATLVATSVLDRCCGPLVDAVVPDGGGGRSLQRLWQEQAFTMPQDHHGRWYRYHPLLREALQRELAVDGSVAVRDLHQRAAGWFAEQGDHDGAVRHLLAARDESSAAHHLVRLVYSTTAESGPAAFRHWFDELSDEVRAQPDVAVALGWSFIQTRDAAQALEWVEQAIRAATEPAELLEFLVLAAFVNRSLFRHDDCVTRATEALGLLPALRSRPRRAALLQLIATNQLAEVALWNGDLDAFDRRLAEGFPLLERSANRLAEVRMRGVQAFAALHRGDVRAARATAELGCSYAQRFDLDASHAAAEVELALAAVAHEVGDEAAASHHLAAGTSLVEATRWPTTAVFSQMLAASFGPIDAAHAAVSELQEMERRCSDRALTSRIVVARLLLALRRGALDDVRHELARLDALPRLPDTARVAVLAAMHVDDSSRVLSGALALSGGGPADRVVALGARAHHATRRSGADAARPFVIEAMRIGEEQGLWATVVSSLASTAAASPAALDIEATVAGIGADYLTGIAASVRGATSPRAAVLSRFSERERGVVELLPTRLSNEEIARQLFISVNTVKTHLRHIYRKLDVGNRDEAVAMLAALGVLAGGRRTITPLGG